MKNLPKHTLIIADTLNYGKAICSLRESLKYINPARTIFFTDVDMELDGIEIVRIPTLTSKADYSKWIIIELYKHITTEYILITQHDAFCLSDKYLDVFYDFDLIGAKWLYTDGRNNSNGGFAQRSLRLQTILGTDPMIQIYDPEDAVISRLYRRYLEQTYGIRFPPDEICDLFSFELAEPINETFGFHSYFWPPFQEHIVITRKDSLGDVVAVQPILEYFNNKGYKVFLNTLPQFQSLFIQHHFRVYFPHELNLNVKFREISLDMAYESFPKMNHLDAYYQACGIPIEERVMKNPKLTLDFDTKMPENRLFDKYVTIHADIRGQGGRNIYELDWDAVASYLIKQGFTVLQVGRGESPEIKGAIRMNTPTEPYMMWVLGGADFFIGIDSGLANVSVAMGVPSVIFTGSVDLRLIFPDLSNILWVNNNEKKRCSTPMCWHLNPGTQGIDCYIDEKLPPCVKFDTYEVLSKIDTFIKERCN